MSVALDTVSYPMSHPFPTSYPSPSGSAPHAVPRCRLRVVEDLPLREAQPDSPRDAEVAYLRGPAGRETASPLRLTRRGVAVLSLAVAVLGGGLVWLAALSAPSSAAAPRVPAAVTVRAGDTVWSIAQSYAGTRDPRDVASQIEELNHLRSAAIVPGQVLRLH